MKLSITTFLSASALLFAGQQVSAEEVQYEFAFVVKDSTRYLGNDPTIESALATEGEIITGVLSYDTDASAEPVPNNSEATQYPQNGFNAGISVVQANGVTWAGNAGSFVVTVIDRESGFDVVTFESKGADGATIDVPGVANPCLDEPDSTNPCLSVDSIKLSLFYGQGTAANGEEGTAGSIGFGANYIFPDGPANAVDIRAIDSNNSEFRIFGELVSLQKVPVDNNPLVCGSISLPTTHEYTDNQNYSCATDFSQTGRFDANTQEELMTYMMGGYGDDGNGVFKNLRVRFSPDDDTIIMSPCSIRFSGEKNISTDVNRLTLLGGGTIRVRPRSGSMTVSEKLTVVSRDEEAVIVAEETISVGELCLQAPNVRINSIGSTTISAARLFAVSANDDGTATSSSVDVGAIDIENSVLRLRSKAESDEM